MYLEKNFKQFNIKYFFHSGKQHGITDEIMGEIESLDLDLLLVADAGSNDFGNHKKLYDKNIMVCIIDHHECIQMSEHALVVNTQLSPEYNNKQLSGVGVVYRLLQALDSEFGYDDADNFLDLTALGNIADAQLMIEPETRYYVYEGIKNLQNDWLKEMIFKNIGKWEKVYPHTLSFNLIPKMNAMIRVGSQEDKQKMFYAMIGRKEEFYNTRTKKTESLIETSVRTCTNAHASGNRLKKKWLGIIKEKIETENLNSRPILVITFSPKDKFDGNLGGVIASGLTNIYRKPVIIMTDKKSDGIYSGSLRGYDEFSSDLKSFLEELNIFDWIQGHGNAAGCQITAENLETFGKMQDKMIEQFTLEGNNTEDNEIKVDFIISAKNMRGGIIEEVSKYEKYWGKGISSPLFAIEGLEIDMNDVKVSTGGMISLEVNGVSYTQFTATQEWIDLAETNQVVTFDAIGTLNVNSFMGKEKKQCIMDNYVIKSVEESKKKKFKFEF